MSNEANKDFVLDCSMAISWVFPDEADTRTRRIRSKLKSCCARVPSIWHYEIANVLMISERRKRITEAEGVKIKSIFSVLPIVIDETTQDRLWGEITNLSRELSLSVYDAVYLELAMREDLPLATLDKKLKEAAQMVGIKTI